MEIEVIIKELMIKKNKEAQLEARNILQSLSDAYHSSSSLNMKKGILLALAAAAIGFGRDAKPFLTGKCSI